MADLLQRLSGLQLNLLLGIAKNRIRLFFRLDLEIFPQVFGVGTGFCQDRFRFKASLLDAAKVPAVTLGFWIIKILATTLGETGGDSITMSWLGETTSAATGYGYLIGTGLLLMALSRIRRPRLMPAKQAGVLAIGHRSRI